MHQHLSSCTFNLLSKSLKSLKKEKMQKCWVAVPPSPKISLIQIFAGLFRFIAWLSSDSSIRKYQFTLHYISLMMWSIMPNIFSIERLDVLVRGQTAIFSANRGWPLQLLYWCTYNCDGWHSQYFVHTCFLWAAENALACYHIFSICHF